MKLKVHLALALVASIAAAGTALAHHSYAMFDSTKEVKVSGVVKTFAWVNPHSHLDVDDGSGVWKIEMGSPNIMKRWGWSRNTLKPGDKVTVTLNPAKDGTRAGSYLKVLLPTGQVLTGAQ